MPDKVRVNKDHGIIEVQSFDIVSKKDIAESIVQIRSIFEKERFYKVLVDATQQKALPDVGDIFEIFSIFPKEFRIAMLIHESQETAEDIHFIENVGVNRDAVMKTFSEKEQALKWLDEK